MKIAKPKALRPQVDNWRTDPKPGWYLLTDNNNTFPYCFMLCIHRADNAGFITASCWDHKDFRTADAFEFSIPINWEYVKLYPLETDDEITWAAQLRILQK